MIPVKLGAKVVIINQFRPEARSQESEVKMLQTARPYDCRTAGLHNNSYIIWNRLRNPARKLITIIR
jgi:hypothetical protein